MQITRRGPVSVLKYVDVTLQPAVTYFRQARKVKVKSFVFVSNEIRHDAKFIFTLLKKLIPHIRLLVPNAKHFHFFSDSPTSQYRNKTILNSPTITRNISVEKPLGTIPKLGTARDHVTQLVVPKCQADMAVRHGKVIIQDAADFYSWASSERGCIDYLFINVEDYEESENILADLMVNIQAVKGTMKMHAVKSAKHSNKVKVRGTSCYC